MYGVGENDLIQLGGTDFTLFTKYIKYNAVLFAITTLINCPILLPVYVSGDPL